MNFVKNPTPRKNDQIQKPIHDYNSTLSTKQDKCDNLNADTSKCAKMPMSPMPVKSRAGTSSPSKASVGNLKQSPPKVEKRAVDASKEPVKKRIKCVKTKTEKDKKQNLILSKSIYQKKYNSFICKFCCKPFGDVESLREHVAAHGNDPSLQCHVCGLESTTFSSLMSHCVKHSRPKDKKKEATLYKQIKVHEKKSNIYCVHCKISFPSTEKLVTHFCPIASQKNEYNCAYCGHVSPSVDDYRLHVLSHSVTPFLCSHCNFKGPTKKMLDKHHEVCRKRPKHLKLSPMKCKDCKVDFKSKKDFNHHQKECKEKCDSKLISQMCTNCNLTFNKADEYGKHILECSKKQAAMSEIISVETVMSTKTEIPIKNSLVKDSTEKEFPCSFCGEIFDTEFEFESHKLECEDLKASAENISSFPCEQMFLDANLKQHQNDCSYTTTTERSLRTCRTKKESSSSRRSRRLVRRKNSFIEDDTEFLELPKVKRFRKKGTNKVILKLNSRKGRQSKMGKDSFTCTDCNLTFCSKSTLLRHKRMHSGNPYFSCKFCGKFFFRKDVYTRHEMNVHSKSTISIYCCYYCKLFFADTTSLKDHVLLTHKENAFMPMVKSSESDTFIEVKKELGNTEIIDNMPGENSPLKSQTSTILTHPLKKCGVCFETFITIVEIENHMESHPKVETQDSHSDVDVVSLPAVKLESNMSANDQIAPKKRTYKRRKLINKVEPLTNNVPISNATNSLNLPESLNADILSQEEDLNCSETTDIYNEHKCKLCLQVFSCESLLISHEKSQHKILDWYRCLVCDTFGPKKDMIDHMFSHMYKIGTFVVSNDIKQLDALCPHFELFNSKEKHENGYSVQEDNNTLGQLIPFSTCIDESILPPLVDYGGSVDTGLNKNILSQSTVLFESDPSVEFTCIAPTELQPIVNNKPPANFNQSMQTTEACIDPSVSVVNSFNVSEETLISNLVTSHFNNEPSFKAEASENQEDKLNPSVENTKFSQLRYLLENFKNKEPSDKDSFSNNSNDYQNKQSDEHAKFVQLRSLLKSIPINSLRNIKDNISQLRSQNIKQNECYPKPSENVIEEKSPLKITPSLHLLKVPSTVSSKNESINDNICYNKSEFPKLEQSLLSKQHSNINTSLIKTSNLKTVKTFAETEQKTIRSPENCIHSSTFEISSTEDLLLSPGILQICDLEEISSPLTAKSPEKRCQKMDSFITAEPFQNSNIHNNSQHKKITSSVEKVEQTKQFTYPGAASTSTYNSNFYESGSTPKISKYKRRLQFDQPETSQKLHSPSSAVKTIENSLTLAQQKEIYDFSTTVFKRFDKNLPNLDSPLSPDDSLDDLYVFDSPNQNLNSNKGTLHCNKCQQKFINISELALHVCSVASTPRRNSSLTFSDPNHIFLPPAESVTPVKQSPGKFDSFNSPDRGQGLKGTYLCSLCNKTFLTSSELRQHYLCEHNHSPSPNSTCDKCNRTFNSVADCRMHSLVCVESYNINSFYSPSKINRSFQLPSTITSPQSDSQKKPFS